MAEIVPLHIPKMDKQALVVRGNDLIESRHSMTLVERRFMLWIVSQISKDDEDLKAYSISVREWIEFAGLQNQPKIYQDIQNMARRLIQRNVEIHQGDGSYKLFPWFYGIEYHAGMGQLTAKMHPDLKPHLLELKSRFTKMTLEHALLLKSVYAGRIYDLLKKSEHIGERIIEISELRGMLQLEKKLARFQDLRRRVLEPAQKEINAITDIAFDWSPLKQGRKYTKIKFTIRPNKPYVTLENREEIDPKAKRFYHQLCKRGIAENMARRLVNDYDDERIKWHIEKFDTKISTGEINGTGWLVKGIEQDYRTEKTFLNIGLEENDKSLEVITKYYEYARATAIQKERDNMKKSARDKIDDSFIKYWEDHRQEDKRGIAQAFKKHGLALYFVALKYESFLPDFSFPNLEEWARQEGYDIKI